MFSQLKQRQHSILANPAAMLVCEDNLSVSWTQPEQSFIGKRGNYDTQGFLGSTETI